MRTLVVYYSRTGGTKKVATTLARILNADLAEIRCDAYKLGMLGFLKAGRDSMRGTLPPIALPPAVQESYDRVIIGAPVWAGHPATPVRAFLGGDTKLPDRIALFLSYNGSPPEKPLAEFEALLPVAAEAKLALMRKDIRRDTIGDALRKFASQLAA